MPSDYEKELNRLLDQVHGDPIDAERQEKFRRAFDAALDAGVDIPSELKQATRAYREMTSGKLREIGGVSLHRGLVDGGVLCELDCATNFLLSATRKAKGGSS